MTVNSVAAKIMSQPPYTNDNITPEYEELAKNVLGVGYAGKSDRLIIKGLRVKICLLSLAGVDTVRILLLLASKRIVDGHKDTSNDTNVHLGNDAVS